MTPITMESRCNMLLCFAFCFFVLCDPFSRNGAKKQSTRSRKQGARAKSKTRAVQALIAYNWHIFYENPERHLLFAFHYMLCAFLLFLRCFIRPVDIQVIVWKVWVSFAVCFFLFAVCCMLVQLYWWLAHVCSRPITTFD